MCWRIDMDDLGMARERLVERDLTLCIAKQGKLLFESHSRGISGFLRAIDELGEELVGASAADKVVGKAVALLSVYGRVEALYACVLSRKAMELLKREGIHVEWNETVETILNRCEPVSCPFETAAQDIVDPEEAYKKLKALQDSLKLR